MSTPAVSAVWKHSRAKGSDLLTLLYLAECSQQDGRDAFPSVTDIAEKTRLTERGVRYVLHRLEASGEIVIDQNLEGRTITTSRGRTFAPQWFIDVRCLCDQDAYLTAEQQEKISSPDFKEGRRQREKISRNGADANRQTLPHNRNGASEKPEKSCTPTLYPRARVGSVTDPSQDLQAGAAPLHSLEQKPENPTDNIGVITKLAHQVLDLYEDCQEPLTLGDISEAVKRHCATLDIAYDSGVIGSAIDSAAVQRARVGKPPVVPELAQQRRRA